MPLGSTTSPFQAADQMAASAPGSGWDAAAAPEAPSQTPPAAPQQPPATPGTPTPTTTPPGAPAAPGAAATPPAAVQPVVVTSQKRGGIMGVVDSIADALAGKTKPEIGTDAQGNQYIKQESLTRGQQWVRIGAGLIAGAAKGWAAGRGRNPGGAAAAGFEAGQQQAEQAAQQTPELQKQMLANANYQKLRMDAAEQSWHLTQLKHEATQKDIEFAQGQEDRLMKVDGATLLGTAEHPGDIGEILKADPNVMESMIKNHQVEILPHYNPDGSAGGIRVFKMPDSYRKTIEPAGSLFYTFDSTTGDYVQHHSADPLTAGEIDDYNTAASNAAQKYKLAQATLAKTQQETATSAATASEAPSVIERNKGAAAASRAAAVKDYAQAQALKEGTDAATIQSNAQQLVEGTADPSNLSKRSKTYDATLAAANAYSMAKYGKPFDLAKAAGDYKFATNANTYNTLNFLNSLTGRDNKSGNLGTVVTLSNNLGQSKFPALNDVEQWAKISAGNPQIAAYRAALTETSDQIAKILQGGGSGSGTSDAKLKQAGDLLNKNFNAAQIKETADTLRTLLGNRKQEIIGDNRYLQSWHGTPAAIAAPPAAGNGAHIFNSTAWAAANPKGDVNAAIAQAKQQGYQVVQ